MGGHPYSFNKYIYDVTWLGSQRTEFRAYCVQIILKMRIKEEDCRKMLCNFFDTPEWITEIKNCSSIR